MLTDSQRVALAARLRRGREGSAGEVPRRPAGLTDLPLSFGQEQLWFIDRFAPGLPTYNIPLALKLSGALDPVALGRAVTALAARHEALRTRLVTNATRLTDTGSTTTATTTLRRRLDIFTAHNQILTGYQPAPTLIITASRSPNAPARHHWPRVLSGPVRTHTADSDHYAFLRPPLLTDTSTAILTWHTATGQPTRHLDDGLRAAPMPQPARTTPNGRPSDPCATVLGTEPERQAGPSGDGAGLRVSAGPATTRART